MFSYLEQIIKVGDVLTAGKSEDEAIDNFVLFLECCKLHNIKLAYCKFQRGCEVNFAWMVVWGLSSYRLCSAKLKAIEDHIFFTEVRSFLSMCNGFLTYSLI